MAYTPLILLSSKFEQILLLIRIMLSEVFNTSNAHVPIGFRKSQLFDFHLCLSIVRRNQPTWPSVKIVFLLNYQTFLFRSCYLLFIQKLKTFLKIFFCCRKVVSHSSFGRCIAPFVFQFFHSQIALLLLNYRWCSFLSWKFIFITR